jgi:hypothetical protein
MVVVSDDEMTGGNLAAELMALISGDRASSCDDRKSAVGLCANVTVAHTDDPKIIMDAKTAFLIIGIDLID